MTSVKLKVTRENTVQVSIPSNIGYCGDFLAPHTSSSSRYSLTSASGKKQLFT